MVYNVLKVCAASIKISRSLKKPGPVNTMGGLGRLILRFPNSFLHIVLHEAKPCHGKK